MALNYTFINYNETIGKIIQGGLENVGGDLAVIFLMIILLLIAMALMFGIPLEFTAIIIFPMLIALSSYYPVAPLFIGIGAIIIIYFALLIARNFIFR